MPTVAIGIEKKAKIEVRYNLQKDITAIYINGEIAKLLSEKYIELGKLSELTDEQCKLLVENCPYYAKCWKKYDADHEYGCPEGGFNADYSCWTSKESFISKLKSEGKLCKWMMRTPPNSFSNPAEHTHYNSLPDDLLILILK